MIDLPELPPDQQEFKLNDVCKLANVQPYMLRFWGTEFPQLEAAKSGTGQRLYSRDQVKLILRIRELLFDEGMTIAGARKRIAAEEGPAAPDTVAAPGAAVAEPTTAAEAVAIPVEEPLGTSPPKRAPRPRPPLRGPDPEPPPAVSDLHLERARSALRHVRDELAGIVSELRKPE